MAKVLPCDPLSAESLRSIHEGGRDGTGRALTLRMRSRSLVTYARTTLIATRRPWYVPCDTSAKPPDSTSTESSEQSGICMEVGITRCRLHALQSLLSNFSRSRSDMASSSRCCNSSCQPWEKRCDKPYLIHFINTPLDFWLRIPQKPEESGNQRQSFFKLLLACFSVRVFQPS